MEILAINRPPIAPIGSDLNIVTCEKCDAIIKYDYIDIIEEPVKKMGDYIKYIHCPSCNNKIMVSSKYMPNHNNSL